MGDPLDDLYAPVQVPRSALKPFEPETVHSGFLGAMGRSAVRGAAPAAGGLAAFPLGAGAGAAAVAPLAAISGPGAPFVEGFGTLAGGLGASFAGAGAVEKAQDHVFAALPDRVQRWLGIDQATRARDETEHPYASFAGSMLPQALAMKPSRSMLQAGTGLVLGAGVEAGSEYAQTGQIDGWKVAGAGAAGVLFGGDPRRAGHLLMAPAERIARGAGRTMAAVGARRTLAAAVDGAEGLDDARLAAAFRHMAGDRATPDERAAATVLDHDAVVAAANPFAATPEGAEAHGDRLTAAVAAALADRPAPELPEPTPLEAHGVDLATVKAVIGHHESGGSYTAKNPLPGQTAFGKYQFTDDTWLGVGQEIYGRTRTRDQIMAMRRDPAAQEAFMDHATEDYARRYHRAGIQVTPGRIYLMHFLGPNRALAVLRATPEMPVDALLPPKAIRANEKWLRGRTAGQLVAEMEQRAGGPQGEPPAAHGDAPAAIASEPMLDPAVPEQVPLIELADRRGGAPARKGPVDVLTFLADRGGIADDENHALLESRNLQRFIPRAGMLVRKGGMSTDRAGELLWEAGYFGPSETVPRPDTFQILEMLDRGAERKTYRPEDTEAVAHAESGKADDLREDNVRQAVQQQADAFEMQLDPAWEDRVVHHVMNGAPIDEAIDHAAGELGRGHLDTQEVETGNDEWYIPGFDAERDALLPQVDAAADAGLGSDDPAIREGDRGSADEPRGASRDGTEPGTLRAAAAGPREGLSGKALARFDDPAGDGARAQAESLEHDLVMEQVAGDTPAPPVDERGGSGGRDGSPAPGANDQVASAAADGQRQLRAASDRAGARVAAEAFLGKPLTNGETGMVAVVSRRSLEKMLSGKAAAKSSEFRHQLFAVANADSLYRRATLDHSHVDRAGNVDYAAIHRFVTAVEAPDGALLAVKLTVKETRSANDSNPLYTVETIDIGGEGEARIGATLPQEQASAPADRTDAAPPGFSPKVAAELALFKAAHADARTGFAIEDEGTPRTLDDILAEAAEEEEAAAQLRACLPPKGPQP